MCSCVCVCDIKLPKRFLDQNPLELPSSSRLHPITIHH